MLHPLAYKALVPCVVLVLTWLVSTLSPSRPAIELPRVRTRSKQGLEKIQAAREVDFAPSLALLPQLGKGLSCSLHVS